ncbi:MAG: tetratricopeptide repeat protein [candidate division Zixibacteria bacterium]|nr:tetratricopeptide repeat protein [candidate division Zixibacteria bacterium]
MSSPHNKNKTLQSGAFDYKSLYRLLGILITGYLIGGFLPVTFAWGFNYLGLIPLPWSVIFPVLVLIFLIPSLCEKISQILGGFVSVTAQFLRRYNRFAVGLAGLGLVFVIFYIFRSEAHVYGDGFTRLEGYAVKTGPLIYDKLFLESGSILLPHYVYRLLNSLFDISPEHAYALVTSMGGVAGIWALFALASILAGDNLERWFLFIGALTSGAVILFFGYIENYTWSTALSLWALYWSLRYVKDKAPYWPMFLFALGAVFFHLITTPILVTVLLILLIKGTARRKKPFEPLVRNIALLAAVGSVGIVLLFQFSNWPMIFVPLWPAREIPYWFLSRAHLVDFINQLLLVAPLGVVTFAMLLIVKKYRSEKLNIESTVLAVATLVTMVACFWIDPEIGAIRDWDLISLFGFPFSLWGAYTLVKLKGTGRVTPSWLLAITLVMLIAVGPNLIDKNNLETAVKRVDTSLWQDSHYQLDYKKANRCVSWGYILYMNTGNKEQSIKYFRRNLLVNPNSFQALANISEVYYDLKRFDSAHYFLTRVVELAPDNPRYLEKLSHTELVRGEVASSLEHLLQAEKYKPDDVDIQTNLGVIYSQLEKYPEALVHFRRAQRLAPEAYQQNMNLGLAFNNLQNMDSAYYYFTRCQKLEGQGPQNDLTLITKLIYIEKSLGNFPKALEYAFQAVKIQPDNPEIQKELGLLLSALKKYPEAIEPFKKALRLLPDDCGLTLYLGLTFDKVKNYDSAFYYLDKSLVICGSGLKEPYVYVVTFNNALALKKYDRAREMLTLIEQVHPDEKNLDILRRRLEDAVAGK